MKSLIWYKNRTEGEITTACYVANFLVTCIANCSELYNRGCYASCFLRERKIKDYDEVTLLSDD